MLVFAEVHHHVVRISEERNNLENVKVHHHIARIGEEGNNLENQNAPAQPTSAQPTSSTESLWYMLDSDISQTTPGLGQTTPVICGFFFSKFIQQVNTLKSIPFPQHYLCWLIMTWIKVHQTHVSDILSRSFPRGYPLKLLLSSQLDHALYHLRLTPSIHNICGLELIPV